jgi:hypothetical protein
VEEKAERARNRSKRFAISANRMRVCSRLRPGVPLDAHARRWVAGGLYWRCAGYKKELQPCAWLHFQLPLFAAVLDTHRDDDAWLDVAGDLARVSQRVQSSGCRSSADGHSVSHRSSPRRCRAAAVKRYLGWVQLAACVIFIRHDANGFVR